MSPSVKLFLVHLVPLKSDKFFGFFSFDLKSKFFQNYAWFFLHQRHLLLSTKNFCDCSISGALLDDSRMCSHVRKECGQVAANLRPQTPDERKYASRIEVYSDGTDSGVKGADGTASEDDQRPPLPPRPPRPRTTAAPRLNDTGESSISHSYNHWIWRPLQHAAYTGLNKGLSGGTIEFSKPLTNSGNYHTL